MFEKKELISGIDGSKYTKYFYTFNDSDPIVGILFGHFAPFTGPNGHGRMITALKNIGAESFLIATPENNKPFDDEREMFNSHQRAEIIQSYLDSEGLEGEAISYKMKRGGAKSQMGPLVAKAAELFGMNIRPVFCFGPDREDLASDVCNKFGEITDPTHCEYIVDYERGTSGTKVRQLIKAGDIEGIVKETGYKPEVAKKLIDLRKENLKMNESKYIEKLGSNKVTLDFSDKQDAIEFENEMKDKFDFPKIVKKYEIVHGTTESGNRVYLENKTINLRKIYNEARTPWSFVGTTKEDRSSITGFLHSKGFNYLKSYENEKKAKEFSHYVHENYDDFYGEFLKSDLEDAWNEFNLNESKLTEAAIYLGRFTSDDRFLYLDKERNWNEQVDLEDRMIFDSKEEAKNYAKKNFSRYKQVFAYDSADDEDDEEYCPYEVWLHMVDAGIRECEKAFSNVEDAMAYEDSLYKDFAQEIKNGEVKVRHGGW